MWYPLARLPGLKQTFTIGYCDVTSPPPLSSLLGAADLRNATGLRPLVSLVPTHFCPGPPKNKILATPLGETIEQGTKPPAAPWAPQHKWLPTAMGVCSRCVCVCVCLFTTHCCVCVCVHLVKCRAHTWPHVTFLSFPFKLHDESEFIVSGLSMSILVNRLCTGPYKRQTLSEYHTFTK